MIRKIGARSRGVLTPYVSNVDAGINYREFTYVSDGDTNGVFYYLGTDFFGGAWSNPHTLGRITASVVPSLLSGSIEQLVDRTDNAVHSNVDVSNNAFKFDLGATRSLILKAYSFRNRNDTNQTVATSVTVAGSNDNTNFTTLGTFTHTAGVSVWNTKTATPGIAYRYIRFHSNTNNTNNGYISASEFELYGSLYQS